SRRSSSFTRKGGSEDQFCRRFSSAAKLATKSSTAFPSMGIQVKPQLEIFEAR
ncbi:hypothetical protein PIB30_108969, partial [Stylosanthes scabra]|nr:hypothetical protein [Stylosanthes scabra]